MAEHYMEVDELGKVPMANSLRKQDGLKRKILELVRHMPAPDRECETTDFLHALQYVLDEHMLQPLPKQNFEDSEVNKVIKSLVEQIRELQDMYRELEKLCENKQGGDYGFRVQSEQTDTGIYKYRVWREKDWPSGAALPPTDAPHSGWKESEELAILDLMNQIAWSEEEE